MDKRFIQRHGGRLHKRHITSLSNLLTIFHPKINLKDQTIEIDENNQWSCNYLHLRNNSPKGSYTWIVSHRRCERRVRRTLKPMVALANAVSTWRVDTWKTINDPVWKQSIILSIEVAQNHCSRHSGMLMNPLSPPFKNTIIILFEMCAALRRIANPIEICNSIETGILGC